MSDYPSITPPVRTVLDPPWYRYILVPLFSVVEEPVAFAREVMISGGDPRRSFGIEKENAVAELYPSDEREELENGE